MLKVKHNTLLLITGVIWFIASMILLSRAYSWVNLMTSFQLYLGTAIALPFAAIKIYFIFQKLTLKNIQRIQSFNQPNVSLWEFHLKRDKLLIVLMIIIGIGLRSLPFIPKYTLYPVYLGIGMAMFYVWILYLKAFFKKWQWLISNQAILHFYF